jgi:hypothetical protein
MLKLYLLVFVFLLIVIQPSIVRLFNSSSLGRLMLISAIIFCTIQNQMVGLSLAVLVIAIMNETGPENFEDIEQEEEEDNSDDEDGEGEDIEMREKRMITPLSSYNISPITPEDGSGNGSEPDAFSGVEPFSAF